MKPRIDVELCPRRGVSPFPSPDNPRRGKARGAPPGKVLPRGGHRGFGIERHQF